MNLDCERCGSTSPEGSRVCAGCGESYEYLSTPSAGWTPEQYSAWLYSEHFQICRLVDLSGFDSLPRSKQLNYLVGYLYYQVGNGGIWQYLSNLCGPDGPLLVVALREINAEQLAELVAESLAWFPDGRPQAEMADRDDSIEQIPEAVRVLLHDRVSKSLFGKRRSLKILISLRKAVERVSPNGG